MLSRLHVTFLLPGPGHLPVGGVKVVYEYANRLTRRGHQVTVIHAASMYDDDPLKRKLRLGAGYIYRGLTGKYGPASWFEIDKAVVLKWIPSFNERHIPDGDVVIATAWQTAEWAAGYSPRKGHGYYLIQHLELWCGEEERVYATWRLPLRKIVIARWLQEIATAMGQESIYVPNGLDFEVYSLQNPIEQRNPAKVAMLYHELAWKGSREGIEALQMVHQEVPSLQATLFGVHPRPAGLPGWFEYHRCASQELLQKLYNEAAIFVAPSWTEGWGLPASEALMCGAALAATDIGGHREFALDNETALLSPPKEPIKLAENVLRLIRDNELRHRIARNGNAFVQQFTWERAICAFENSFSASSYE